MAAYFADVIDMSTDNNKSLAVSRLIIGTLLFMMVGTVLELYLLGHYESTLQWIPMACIGLSLFLSILLIFKRTNTIIQVFKALMIASALSGLLGTYLHLKANFEFEKEMKPTADNIDVLVESLSGALPSLAPGSMIVLALIGYSYLTIIKQTK